MTKMTTAHAGHAERNFYTLSSSLCPPHFVSNPFLRPLRDVFLLPIFALLISCAAAQNLARAETIQIEELLCFTKADEVRVQASIMATQELSNLDCSGTITER